MTNQANTTRSIACIGLILGLALAGCGGGGSSSPATSSARPTNPNGSANSSGNGASGSEPILSAMRGSSLDGCITTADQGTSNDSPATPQKTDQESLADLGVIQAWANASDAAPNSVDIYAYKSIATAKQEFITLRQQVPQSGNTPTPSYGAGDSTARFGNVIVIYGNTGDPNSQATDTCLTQAGAHADERFTFTKK